MRKGIFGRATAALLIAIVALWPVVGYAQSSNSTNYRVDQTLFGSGGELDAQSSTYHAKQSAGELTVGNTKGTAYQAYAGFNTTDDPFLEFVVTASNIDLGYLDTTTTKTANGTFSVRAWQAGGYTVRTESNPPTNAYAHQLTPLAAPSVPTPGNEEFGINLVQNLTTSPCNAFANFGQDPQQSPDGTFAFGQVDANYNQCGKFKYAKGDRVAYSTQSTSVTTYTVSYIFNISTLTQAGQYTFNHVLVATGTY